MYFIHLFLRVGYLNPNNPLGGPVRGWEIVTGLGIAFLVTIPLFGDLAFWIASALLAIGSFGGARIAAGIALVLSSTLWMWFVVDAMRQEYKCTRVVPWQGI